MDSNKMILVLAEKNQISVSRVVKYLKKRKNCKVVTIYKEDLINNVRIDRSGLEFFSNNNWISLSEVDCVWYYRGRLSYNMTESIDFEFIDRLFLEWSEINDFTHFFLMKEKKVYGTFFLEKRLNRLMQYWYALKVELKIPGYLVCA